MELCSRNDKIIYWAIIDIIKVDEYELRMIDRWYDYFLNDE